MSNDAPRIPETAFDEINKAAHYNQGDVECIDAVRAALSTEEFIGAMKFQIFKYNWRGNAKETPIKNARKSEYYHKRMIEAMEAADTKPLPELVILADRTVRDSVTGKAYGVLSSAITLTAKQDEDKTDEQPTSNV